jgi:hypothetical protein
VEQPHDASCICPIELGGIDWSYLVDNPESKLQLESIGDKYTSGSAIVRKTRCTSSIAYSNQSLTVSPYHPAHMMPSTAPQWFKIQAITFVYEATEFRGHNICMLMPNFPFTLWRLRLQMQKSDRRTPMRCPCCSYSVKKRVARPVKNFSLG